MHAQGTRSSSHSFITVALGWMARCSRGGVFACFFIKILSFGPYMGFIVSGCKSHHATDGEGNSIWRIVLFNPPTCLSFCPAAMYLLVVYRLYLADTLPCGNIGNEEAMRMALPLFLNREDGRALSYVMRGDEAYQVFLKGCFKVDGGGSPGTFTCLFDRRHWVGGTPVRHQCSTSPCFHDTGHHHCPPAYYPP